MRLAGKVALVTGAAQGLGAAIAERFLSEGAIVYGGDLCKGTTVAKSRPAGIQNLVLDVSSESSWRAAIAAVKTGSGRLDILVNNAGINIRQNIEEMTLEALDDMLAVNVKGPFLGIKHSLALMRAGGGGLILNMSSLCGLVGHRYTNEAYTMTKGAITLLSKAVAVRHAKDGIRCNSVHPSTVDTPLVQAVLSDPQRRAERFSEVPLGRLATTADVVAAFVFLASDEAAFINGVAFPVDGGSSAD